MYNRQSTQRVRNEKETGHFIDKLEQFTNNKFKFLITWKTRKIRSLFTLKDKNLYPACLVYKGVCSCLEDYIGETKQNSVNRWSQHNYPSKKSNPAIHLNENIEHLVCNRGINTEYKKAENPGSTIHSQI